jgi:hypothetical protein
MENSIEWRDVKGYEGLYKISNLGHVFSLDRKITTKQGRTYLRKGMAITVRLNNFGYLDTRLCKNGIKKSVFVHRIIAEAFIDNPNNYCCVNHKDLNRQNNSIENLEWVTSKMNAEHARRMRRLSAKHSKGRPVIDVCTGVAYPSIRKAAKALNVSYSSCKRMINGYGKNMIPCLKLAS